MNQTLGTQLRHLMDLLDGAVARRYVKLGLRYRPRYTPVLRALIASEPRTVGEIALAAGITQPAATQTIALMLKDNLIETSSSDDGRKRPFRLTRHGQALLPQIQEAWKVTALAAVSLDDELPAPLSDALGAAIEALTHKSFDERISEASFDIPNPTGEDFD